MSAASGAGTAGRRLPDLPRHRSRERAPADRGRAFGAAFAEQVRATVATYVRMFAENRDQDAAEVARRGGAAAERVRAFRPALADEIEGIAAGAGVPAALLFAVNARTELLAGGRLTGALECSTVGVGGPERVVLAQNWDFHPDLADARVLWTIHDEHGWRCVFAEAGMVGKFGLSSRGLATTLNFLASDADADGGELGVPVHVLARALLDECATIEEAQALLAGTALSSSVCITVAGPRDGRLDVVAFERWPGGLAALDRDGAAWLVHTNHFLAEEAAPRDLTRRTGGAGWRSSRDRLARLRALAPALRDDPATVGELLTDRCEDGGAVPVFRERDPDAAWLFRRVTLATVAFELPACRVWALPELDPERPLEPLRP